VDFDNLIVRVTGKGNKKPLVPFSLQGRKHIYRLIRATDRERYLFRTANGGVLSRHNIYRNSRSSVASSGSPET